LLVSLLIYDPVMIFDQIRSFHTVTWYAFIQLSQC
jgi:hypothetical protein